MAMSAPLVAEHAARRAEEPRIRQRPDLGQHLPGHVEGRQQLVVPVELLEVHQHGSAGIGDIGQVHTAVRAAGQVPQQRRVDGPEERVTGLRGLAEPVDLLEQPGQLPAREVRRRRETRSPPAQVAVPVSLEMMYQTGRSRLPRHSRDQPSRPWRRLPGVWWPRKRACRARSSSDVA
jgi:hypothetical protein